MNNTLKNGGGGGGHNQGLNQSIISYKKKLQVLPSKKMEQFNLKQFMNGSLYQPNMILRVQKTNHKTQVLNSDILNTLTEYAGGGGGSKDHHTP